MRNLTMLLHWVALLLRWGALSIAMLCADIVAIIITPAVIRLADRETGRLPKKYRWMETPTAPLPGSKGFVRKNLPRFGWYWTAVFWLWRNTAYGLCDKFRVDPDFDSVRFWHRGNIDVNNDPYVPGYFLGTMEWLDRKGDIRRAFEVRLVFPVPFQKCFMLRAGWKLSAWFDGRRPEKPTATGMLQPFSPRPLLSRK